MFPNFSTWHKITFFLLLVLLSNFELVYSQDWGKAQKLDQSSFKLFNVNWYKQTSYSEEFYWIKLAMIALALCFFANIIIYMLGKAFDAENVKKFAISEFYQTTATGFLIVFFLAFLSIGFGYIQSLFLSDSAVFLCQGQQIKLWSESAGPFTLIKCKIAQYLEAAYALYLDVYNKNKAKEVEGSKCVSYVGWQICKIWEGDLYKEIETYHYIANRLATLSISLVAQYFFVTYLEQNLLSFFLPVGLLLRLIPPLRGIGGLFIAVAVGFYFIFPIAYIFIQPSLVQEIPQGSGTSTQDKIQTICFEKMGPFASFSFQKEEKVSDKLEFSSDLEQFIVEVSLATFLYPFLSLAITII
ncbi:MAG: hypothetical protein N3D10_02250, partial [Candidatus Micrarchaeota archaeon]|nr:hypothetical protein [Candidatus Micrarchaeota archaeon]